MRFTATVIIIIIIGAIALVSLLALGSANENAHQVAVNAQEQNADLVDLAREMIASNERIVAMLAGQRDGKSSVPWVALLLLAVVGGVAVWRMIQRSEQRHREMMAALLLQSGRDARALVEGKRRLMDTRVIPHDVEARR